MNGQQWILDLQVGDPVYVANRYGWTKTTVTKKTPSGRITVQEGRVFSPSGQEWGTASHIRGSSLRPWTQEREDEFAAEAYREKLILEFRHFADQRKAHTLTNDQIERILSIVNENNQPKEDEK